jgi:hypothetical protein
MKTNQLIQELKKAHDSEEFTYLDFDNNQAISIANFTLEKKSLRNVYGFVPGLNIDRKFAIDKVLAKRKIKLSKVLIKLIKDGAEVSINEFELVLRYQKGNLIKEFAFKLIDTHELKQSDEKQVMQIIQKLQDSNKEPIGEIRYTILGYGVTMEEHDRVTNFAIRRNLKVIKEEHIKQVIPRYR